MTPTEQSRKLAMELADKINQPHVIWDDEEVAQLIESTLCLPEMLAVVETARALIGPKTIGGVPALPLSMSELRIHDALTTLHTALQKKG